MYLQWAGHMHAPPCIPGAVLQKGGWICRRNLPWRLGWSILNYSWGCPNPLKWHTHGACIMTAVLEANWSCHTERLSLYYSIHRCIYIIVPTRWFHMYQNNKLRVGSTKHYNKSTYGLINLTGSCISSYIYILLLNFGHKAYTAVIRVNTTC